MSKVAIVMSSELGQNCWSPMRFTHQCYKCDKYRKCDYPERVANKRVDELHADLKAQRDKLTSLQNELKEYTSRS